MKKWITLLIVLLIAWMFGATYYWVCHVKSLCCQSDDNSDAKTVLVVEPSAAPVVENSTGLITIKLSDSAAAQSFVADFNADGTPEVNTQITQKLDALSSKINAQLRNNPAAITVTVVGMYDANESVTGDYDNMGQVRANWMRDELVSRRVNPNAIQWSAKELPITSNPNTPTLISVMLVEKVNQGVALQSEQKTQQEVAEREAEQEVVQQKVPQPDLNVAIEPDAESVPDAEGSENDELVSDEPQLGMPQSDKSQGSDNPPAASTGTAAEFYTGQIDIQLNESAPLTSVGVVTNDAMLPEANDRVKAELDQLAANVKTLVSSTPSDLAITGYFNRSEKPPEPYSNMGLARAGWLADQLAARGLNRDDMILSYGLLPDSATLEPTTGEQDTDISNVPTLVMVQLVARPELTSTNSTTSDDTSTDTTGNDSDSSNDNMVETLPAWLNQSVIVRFETGESFFELNNDDRAQLVRLIQFVRAHEAYKMVAAGHTDNVGSRTNNIDLSLQRAASVGDVLREFGLKTEQITMRGYGPDQPVADNATAEGRALNRRVEIKAVAE